MTTFDEQLAVRENFIGENGKLYLVRCVACGADTPPGSRENYLPAVASGRCAWCGWPAPSPSEESGE